MLDSLTHSEACSTIESLCNDKVLLESCFHLIAFFLVDWLVDQSISSAIQPGNLINVPVRPRFCAIHVPSCFTAVLVRNRVMSATS